MDYQCTQPSEIKICRQAEEIERQREIKGRNRVHEETMQMLREMIKIQEEKRIHEKAARQEEAKRIAKEKEAAKLEAKCKIQECLNIEEKSIPQASTRSKKFRIDLTLNLVPTPSESDVIFDGDCDDYQKRFDLKVQQLWMPSIYDENNKIRECYIIRPSAITPDLPIPDSLIMEDEHLDTIPVTESANTIKSSVEDLVPTPSESADLSDGESECDVPVGDESSSTFTTFSNPLFDSNDDFTSSDDESLSDEDVPKENFKIYSNPLFDEEIISTKIDPHCFNAESYLIESLLNRDTLIDSSPKFDYLLEEFSGELAHTDPIPPGVVDTDSEPEEEIRLAENLSYDNSSPRPPEERNSEIADTIVESLSPPPIPVEDSDSLMEEIDLFLASDDSMPPGIEIDDYDSEGDIYFLEELLSSDSPPLPENESFSLDHFDDPSLPRPPPEPPDVEICFKFEPDAGDFINKVVGDISEHDVLMPSLLPTQPTFVQCVGKYKSEGQSTAKLKVKVLPARENGLLIFHDRYYLGAESKLKTPLLHEFHNTSSADHGGSKKMLVGLSALFYWKGMRKSVEDFIKHCLICQQTKYSTKAVGGLLQPLPTPSAVWEDVSMDFITGLPSSKGLMVILVVVDHFSKYAHFGALSTNFNAHMVVELFMDIVVKHHGIPKTIVSNRDPIFVSKFWKQLF
ncbi:transposase, Ptta/En/Spm, transposase, Tnp1/En/Spm-like protein [Tanacetum coccineum]